MSQIARLLPLAALLGAWVAAAPKVEEPRAPGAVDRAWTSRGFAEQLQAAADRAGAELREAPEVAWADVAVRSIDDHAPLQVEASIEWSSAVPAERQEALLSAVRSWFESFAIVEVVTK